MTLSTPSAGACDDLDAVADSKSSCEQITIKDEMEMEPNLCLENTIEIAEAGDVLVKQFDLR